MNELTDSETVRCLGCGGRVPIIDGPGPTHAYMASSPGCWAMFGEVSAREYSDLAYRRSGRQLIDAYAVQHPGVNERRAAQSVWVHLVSLCLVLEHDLPVEQAAGAMQRLLAGQPQFEWLEPPASLGDVTVVDVHAAQTAEEHIAAVRRWCDSAWAAWERHQARIRESARRLL